MPGKRGGSGTTPAPHRDGPETSKDKRAGRLLPPRKKTSLLDRVVDAAKLGGSIDQLAIRGVKAADSVAGAAIGLKPSDIGRTVADPSWGLKTYKRYREKASAVEKMQERAAKQAFLAGDREAAIRLAPTYAGTAEVPWVPKGVRFREPNEIAREALRNSYARTLPAGRSNSADSGGLKFRRDIDKEREWLRDRDVESSFRQDSLGLLNQPSMLAARERVARTLERGQREREGKGTPWPWEVTPAGLLADPHALAHWTLGVPKTPKNRAGHHGGTVQSAFERARDVQYSELADEAAGNPPGPRGRVFPMTIDGLHSPMGEVLTDAAANDLSYALGHRFGGRDIRGIHSGARSRPRDVRMARDPDEAAWAEDYGDTGAAMSVKGWGQMDLEGRSPRDMKAIASNPFGNGIDAESIARDWTVDRVRSAQYLNGVEDVGSISVATIDPFAARSHLDWVMEAARAGERILPDVLRSTGMSENQFRKALMRWEQKRRGKLESPLSPEERARMEVIPFLPRRAREQAAESSLVDVLDLAEARVLPRRVRGTTARRVRRGSRFDRAPRYLSDKELKALLLRAR